jgi:RHS repeat-associated protein
MTGSADTLYTYGANLIALTAPGGVQTYYHYDGLGSVRNLSDGTGAVIASYTYGAFGDLRLMKGSSDNAFQFTGEQTDDETGLIYLRARYYDPSVGRFITPDPLPGQEAWPQSLNRYVYVENNPQNWVDPSGEVAPVVLVGIALLKVADLLLDAQNLTDAWQEYDRIRRESNPDPRELVQIKRKADEAEVKFILGVALPLPFLDDVAWAVMDRIPWLREWRENAIDAWIKLKQKGLVQPVYGSESETVLAPSSGK